MKIRRCEEIRLRCTSALVKTVRGFQPKLSGLGQSNSFRFTLATGWYCPFYMLDSELNVSPVAGIIYGTLTLLPSTTCSRVWIWQYPHIFVLLTRVWWSQLSCIVMTTERKFHKVSLLAKLCYKKTVDFHASLTNISPYKLCSED